MYIYVSSYVLVSVSCVCDRETASLMNGYGWKGCSVRAEMSVYVTVISECVKEKMLVKDDLCAYNRL